MINYCMTKLSFKTAAFVLALVAICSCASAGRPVPVELDVLAPAQSSDQNLRTYSQRLSSYLKKNPGDRSIMEDVPLMLDAMVAEDEGKIEKAKGAWFSALSVARGLFGEKSFSGWLTSFAQSQAKKTDRIEMARAVLAETKGGSVGPWMLSRSLQSEDRIIPILLREIPECVNGVSVESKLDPPQTDGIPSGDPLMTQLAGEVCRYKSQRSESWGQWQGALASDVSKYFEALVFQCSGQSAKALTYFSDVAPRLAANSAYAPLALESYARLIKLRREQGERESVAPLYMPYMQLWKSPSINESTLGLSRSVFEQRRIDETLWAARARASIGDGESARTFADDVLNYVNTALLQSFTLSTEQKNNLAATAAETYHLLAFRLAVESRDWEKSFNIAELALNQAAMPDDWRARFRWSQGLYRFLAGDYEQSRRIWEQLLSESTDDRLRPQLLFWVSRVHDQLGNQSEASFYRKSLAEDYPVSFYSVVALGLTSEDHASDWQSSFSDLKGLGRDLANWQRVDIDDLRADKERGRLLRRAEILTSLRIVPLATLAIEELQRSMEPVSDRSKDQDAWLYVSRLHGAAGNWLGTISLTTKLMKSPDFWRDQPEQFVAYFPRPFLEVYQSVAKDSGIEVSELLAISRQESSFKADAKSGANAWGVMQLMPFTAKRLLSSYNMPNKEKLEIPKDLLKPEVNIRLAANYVRELNGRFKNNQAQVYAAYNAGVQTVDSWISRRLFDDPLLFIELIPYQETRDYVKGVWRNKNVYKYILSKTASD